MKNSLNNIKNFLRFVYAKLFSINDTPNKISLGLGLGVFAGILPGTGPIAAVFLALVFRANRASGLRRAKYDFVITCARKYHRRKDCECDSSHKIAKEKHQL